MTWRRAGVGAGRTGVGAVGERIASWWLTDRGLSIVGQNVRGPQGELDLIAWDGPTRVAVEVRTITGDGDPIDAIDPVKRAHVSRLAAAAGASRVDLVGIALHSDAMVVHWVPG